MKKNIILCMLVAIFLTSCATTTSTEKELPQIKIETIKSGLIKLKANPRRGYNYDAYIYIPTNFIPKDDSNFLLVIPNNTGRPGTIQEHDSSVLNSLTNSWEGNIAKGLGTPLLMPVFPRDSGYYYHQLTYDAIRAGGKNKRIDKQLIYMIKDALTMLEQTHEKPFNDKVLMAGASASGSFVSHFTILHPSLVHAVVTGLNSGIPMLPVKKIGRQVITYPFGIGDIKTISGSEFDMENFKAVKILSLNGALDENSTTFRHGNNIKPYTRESAFRIFGNSIYNRSKKSYEIYSSVTDNFQNILYSNMGHRMDTNDAIAFLKSNMGDNFVPLKETNSPTTLNQYKE